MNPILAGIIGAVFMWYLLALISWFLEADDILNFPIIVLAYIICLPALPFYWIWRMFKHTITPIDREHFNRCKFKHVLNITDNIKLVRESHLTWRFWTWFFFVRIK